MAQGFKATGQFFGIAKHGWQDGEMGHGAMPALADPSDHEGAVQWPLPQDWPSPRQPLRLGVMASGEGSNFEALVESCRRGWAEITLLVVNNDQCGAHRRAERLGIPTTLIDHRHYPKREDLDRALIHTFQQQQVDLVAMAGWMRIVTPLLIQAYPGRLINIHPSLLPSFPGIDGVGQALAAGVTLSGCTAHLVSEEVDAGEILVQAAVPVLKTDDHASLSARIHRQEHNILPLAVALAAQRIGL
jgi:phosphoribosylglycinamide formyltransferase-1